MNILAIDTSTVVCSVALMIEKEIIHLSKHAPREHARLILPTIKEVLAKANLSLSQLNALAFSAGPGSFTGIRIAAGVIQGLAYATDLPVIPISTLATLAQKAYRTLGAKHILPSLDARMNQIYWGAYQIDDHGLVKPLCEDSVTDPQKIFIPKSKDWIGVGSGWDQYGKILRGLLKNGLIDIKPQFFPDAYDATLLAKMKFQAGKYVSAENALPIYLSKGVKS